MFVITNNIKVKKGYASQVAERFRQSKGVTQSPGFVKMEVLVSTQLEEHDELAIRTSWENESYFTDWTNSESFQHAHARTGQPTPENQVMLGSYFTRQELLFTNEANKLEV